MPRPPRCASTQRAADSAAAPVPGAQLGRRLQPAQVLQRAQDLPRLQVRDALADPTPCGHPVAAQHSVPGQPLISHPGFQVLPDPTGLVEAAPQHGVVGVQRRVHQTDPAEHVAGHGRVVDLPGQGDRTGHDAFGLRTLPSVEPDPHGQVAVGHRQVRAGWQDLEHLQRRGQPTLHVRPPPAQPGQRAHPAQVPTHPGGVGLRLPQGERALRSLHRLADQARRRRLDGERLEQVGPLDLGVAIRQLQRPAVVSGRLPVGAGGGRGPGGERRHLDEGVVVACTFGVMHQPGRIGATGPQRAQHASVQPPRPRPWHRLLDSPAGQLVPEGQGPTVDGDHPAFLGSRGGLRPIRKHLIQQPGLCPGRHHGEHVQQLPGGLRQPRHPCQHGLAHRGGQPLLLGGEQLGDEERVAAGGRVHAQARSRVARQLGDRARRQRGERDPNRNRRPQTAQHPLQERDHRHLVVAIGEHQQRAEPLDAAGDEGQRVEAGVVGPVHVLDDHYRRRTAGLVGELVEQRREDRLRGALGQYAGQRGSSRAAHVVHRTERGRSQQVVTGALQDARSRVEFGQEHPHDRRLAHAGAPAQ